MPHQNTKLSDYSRPADMPLTLPVLSRPGVLLLPRLLLPLAVLEPQYISLVHDVVSSHSLLGVVQPCQDQSVAGRTGFDDPDLCAVGCAGRVTNYRELPGGRIMITLVGISRFEIYREMDDMAPYRMFRVNYTGFTDDFTPGLGQALVDRDKLLDTISVYLEISRTSTGWREIETMESETLINLLAALLPYDIEEKQALLEAGDLHLRSEILIALAEKSITRQNNGEQIVRQ